MTTDPPPVRQALTLLGLLAAATVAGAAVGAVLGVAALAVVAAAVGAGCGLAYGWFWPRSVHLVFPVDNAPGYGGREARAALAAVRAGLSFAFWATAGGAGLAGLWLRAVWAGRTGDG